MKTRKHFFFSSPNRPIYCDPRITRNKEKGKESKKKKKNLLLCLDVKMKRKRREGMHLTLLSF